MITNRRKIKVQWGHCDPAGIVYYPRYFEMFDASTAALFEEAGFPKQELLKKFDIVGIPMVDTNAQFLAPATFGDTIEVESRILEWGKSSFCVEHKIYKDEKLIATGFEKRVWTVRKKDVLKSEPIPDKVKKKFA